MKKLATVEDFYNFFKAIPNDKWGTRSYKSNGRCCSLGHLGCRNSFSDYTAEAVLLTELLATESDPTVCITGINDGSKSTVSLSSKIFDELGDTPRERILNALLLKSAGLWDEANS